MVVVPPGHAQPSSGRSSAILGKGSSELTSSRPLSLSPSLKCCPSIIQQRAMTSSRPLGYPQPSVSSSSFLFVADSNRRVATTLHLSLREKWQLRVIISQITARITSFPYAGMEFVTRTRYIRGKSFKIILFNTNFSKRISQSI